MIQFVDGKLHDEKTLAECQIVEDATVHLIKKTAAAPPTAAPILKEAKRWAVVGRSPLIAGKCYQRRGPAGPSGNQSLCLHWTGV